jgi:hypothetical protein
MTPGIQIAHPSAAAPPGGPVALLVLVHLPGLPGPAAVSFDLAGARQLLVDIARAVSDYERRRGGLPE